MMLVVRTGAPAARHRRATLDAELRALRVHAGGDFCLIRDEFRTQPHCIGRTGLTDIDDLSPGAHKAAARRPARPRGRQIAWIAFLFPGFEGLAGTKLAAVKTAVDVYLDAFG
jgi:hypothetical protein